MIFFLKEQTSTVTLTDNKMIVVTIIYKVLSIQVLKTVDSLHSVMDRSTLCIFLLIDFFLTYKGKYMIYCMFWLKYITLQLSSFHGKTSWLIQKKQHFIPDWHSFTGSKIFSLNKLQAHCYFFFFSGETTTAVTTRLTGKASSYFADLAVSNLH